MISSTLFLTGGQLEGQSDTETGKSLCKWDTPANVYMPPIRKSLATWVMVCSAWWDFANINFVTAAAKQEEDVGYSAMLMNYEFLNKNIDPQDMLRSMFSFRLISLEQKEKIKSVQQHKGKEDACEEMLDILFKNWKRRTCETFIQVLEKSNYKKCAAQLESNKICYDECICPHFWKYSTCHFCG